MGDARKQGKIRVRGKRDIPRNHPELTGMNGMVLSKRDTVSFWT